MLNRHIIATKQLESRVVLVLAIMMLLIAQKAPTVLASPKVVSDDNNNLILDAQERNVSIMGGNMLFNGEQLYTGSQISALLSAQQVRFDAALNLLISKTICASNGGLTIFQYLETNSALDLAHFSIGTTNYLAVANNYNNETSSNFIYQLNTKEKKFVIIQQINLSSIVRDVEPFSMNGTTYLALANHYNGSSYNLKSNIYRLDNLTQQFVLFQQIDTVHIIGNTFNLTPPLPPPLTIWL